MKNGDKVTCTGEGDRVFQIHEIDKRTKRALLLLVEGSESVLHGWEPVSKLSPAEEPVHRVWAAWRIETHRDREMTFLGVFDSEERAEAEIKRHREDHPYCREWEYHIRECVMNRPED